jgi:hypothetical protein
VAYKFLLGRSRSDRSIHCVCKEHIDLLFAEDWVACTQQ